MPEISTISIYFAESHMVVNHTPDSNKAKMSGYLRYIRHFSTIYAILVEISAISQKFLHRYIHKNIPNILSNHHFPVYSLHHGYLMGGAPPRHRSPPLTTFRFYFICAIYMSYNFFSSHFDTTTPPMYM